MQIGIESSRAIENKRIFVVDGDEIDRAVPQFMLHDENETYELAGLEAGSGVARLGGSCRSEGSMRWAN
jgi:hypothetical protein